MVEDAAPFPAVAVVLFVIAAVTVELRRIEDSRALSAAEASQLDALARLEDGLQLALPRANDRDFMIGAQPSLTVLLEAANTATLEGVAVIDLLEIGAGVSQGRKWRRFTLQLDHLMWLGVAQLADALRVIVYSLSPPPQPVRKRQLAALSPLQGELARVVELELNDPWIVDAAKRVREWLAAAAAAVGEDMPLILHEAPAIATAGRGRAWRK